MSAHEDGSAMEAEFDTVAGWTEEAVRELGEDHAIPAACRGSGSPADLQWLADGLGLHGDDRFLDAGAGLGGPAAWLREHHRGPEPEADRWRGTPVLVDPMTHAAASSRRLFGFPAVAAWSQQLPVRTDGVDAAWALGVLCTTSERADVLAELRRVLKPGGRLALLVLVAAVDPLPADRPDGNDFPTPEELRAQVGEAGFRIEDEIDASTLPDAPADWTAAADRVDEVVERDHGDDPAFRTAQQQSQAMGRLLGERQVVTTLLRATAV
jgi:SAM-dependent methyltransferase